VVEISKEGAAEDVIALWKNVRSRFEVPISIERAEHGTLQS
jgi:hypothetical protein